jgi:hypothetical protein
MMGDKLIMSAKERRYNEIFAQVLRGYLNLTDCATRLSISYRQTKRLWKKYKIYGAAGLIHANRGKQSGRAKPEGFKKTIINVYREKYQEFGPTLAAEVLYEEDGLDVHPETLRLWLKSEGLWSLHRRRKSYRQKRMRRESFGELLQIDGSIHAWFGENKPHSCLLNIIDDATGITFSQLDSGETTKVLLITLKKWIEKYGIPNAVYVDLKSVYISNQRLKTADDDSKVEDSWSVFQRVCKGLGIKIIKAYSPQAKGRVERNHGVYQDRLVKMLALKNITTIEAANYYLEKEFINKLNQKFAVKAQSTQDLHREIAGYNLERIFCWEYQRQVKNDWTIQWQKRHFQIEKTNSALIRPKHKILVCKSLEDEISLWYKDERLQFKKLESKPALIKIKEKRYYTSEMRSKFAKQNKSKTPWGQFNTTWLKKKSDNIVTLT